MTLATLRNCASCRSIARMESVNPCWRLQRAIFSSAISQCCRLRSRKPIRTPLTSIATWDSTSSASLMLSFGKTRFADQRKSSAPEQPHHPSCYEDSAYEHCEAIETIADLLAGAVSLRDTEHDGSEYGEQQCGAEVGKFQHHLRQDHLSQDHLSQDHGFFPMAMWYGSAPLMNFSSPATI